MTSILAAFVVLGIIIVIHELGHFLVAKFFKIKVETFSVGFGPRLIGFRRGETDYRISAFPLGGYVKMAGETPSDTITGAENEFLSKPKWQRFLVAAAGPAMNVILAVGLLTGLYVYGTDVPDFLIGQAVVGIVEPGSPADRAGIKPADQIAMLDGKEKPDWQDVQNVILTNPDINLPIVIERQGQRIETSITPERKGREESGYAGMGPVIRTIVRRVHDDSPAQKAGLKAGDEIIRVNGIDLKTSGRTIQQTIQDIPEETFPIVVLRDETPQEAAETVDKSDKGFFAAVWDRLLHLGRSAPAADAGGVALGDAGVTRVDNRKEMEIQVTPTIQSDKRKVIGIDIPYPTVQIKLGLVDAFKKSVESNKENAVLIFQVIGKLFKREASLKQLDGPIGIIQYSGQAAEAGLPTLIMLISLISLNLGVMNLLPIPILDGGVIMLLIIEAVMGRDLSLRMKERIVQVSFVFLLMLTVIVIYNDVVKLLPVQQP
jgi:regulator of sigma E protease